MTTPEEWSSILADSLAATKAADRDAAWWRTEAHRWFDMIWKGEHLSRPGAYAWLRKEMGLSKAEAHIKLFDVAQCQRVVDHAKSFLASRGEGRR